VFQQQQSDDQSCIMGGAAGVGELLAVAVFQLVPGDQVGDPKPAVFFIQTATEGEQIFKQWLCIAIFGFVHGSTYG